MKCKYCKKIIEGNSRAILKILTSLGYEDYDFCSEECLKNYINKPTFFEKLFGK